MSVPAVPHHVVLVNKSGLYYSLSVHLCINLCAFKLLRTHSFLISGRLRVKRGGGGKYYLFLFKKHGYSGKVACCQCVTMPLLWMVVW